MGNGEFPAPEKTVQGDKSGTTGQTQSHNLAVTILTLAAAGQAVPDCLLDMLAAGVLAQPMPALALQVREGGPHKLSRAIELAGKVISPVSDHEGRATATASSSH